MSEPSISFTLAGSRHSSPVSPVDEGAVTLTGSSKAVVLIAAVPVGGGSATNGNNLLGSVPLVSILTGGSVEIWWLDDLSGNASGDHLTVDWNAGGHHAQATLFVLDAGYIVALIDSGSASGSGAGPFGVTLSGSATDAIGLGSANAGQSGSITLGSDLVLENSFDFANERSKTFHDVLSPLTAHATHTSLALAVVLAAFGPAPDPDITFAIVDPIGVEVGFQSGVVFGPGIDVTLFPSAFGAEAGFQSGVAFAATGPRQVMLTGNNVETPEMTSGGEDGQVLTYHEGSPPTWEDATGGGGGSMRVREVDSAPNVSPVDTIVVPNGSLTDDGGGQVTIAFAASIDWAEDGDITTQAFGDAAAANVTTEAAPAGHKHGMPANPVTAHEAASDPHPGYLTPAEGNAAYQPLDSDLTAIAALSTTSYGRALLALANQAALMALMDFGETADMVASAPGDTVAAGSSGEVSDAGHRHARESYATLTAGLTYGTTSDMPASLPGDAESAGSSGKVSDAGHKHDRTGEVFVINVVIDGGGVAITTGLKAILHCPFAFTIQQAVTIADVSGSIVIDVWKDSYTNHPPTVADTITASAKPTLSSATKAKDSTLTGWTTSVAADDELAFKVDSATSVTLVTLSLKCVRT